MGSDDPSAPVITLKPVPIEGRSELPRKLNLSYTQKVGRAVLNKTRPAVDNAIFDSKVLSRTHAEIWFDSGKVYIKDTKSSNGTYVNEERLSACGIESPAHELKNGDRLTLGVDVLEHNTASHKCVQLVVGIDGVGVSDADILKPFKKEVPIETIEAQGVDALKDEIVRLRSDIDKQDSTMLRLMTQLSSASDNQLELKGQIAELEGILASIEEAADEDFQSLAHQDRLLSRINAMEGQLSYYMNRNRDEDPSEMQKLQDQLVQAQSDRHHYEMTAKESIKRVMAEKLEILQKLQSLQKEFRETKDKHSRDTTKLKENLDVVVAREKEIRDANEELKDDNADMLTRIRELEEAQLSIEKERLHAAEELAEARMQLEIAQAERTTQTTRDLSGDSEEVQEDGDADPEAQDQIGPLEGPTDAPKQDMQRQRSGSHGTSTVQREGTVVVDQTDSELMDLRKRVHDLELLHKALEARATELEDEAKTANELLAKKERECSLLQRRSQEAEKSVQDLATRLSALQASQDEQKDNSEAVNEVTTKLKEAQEQLSDLQTKHETLSQHAARYEQELAATKAQLGKQMASKKEVDELKSTKEQQGQELQSLKFETKRRETELRNLQEQLERSQKMIAGANVQCKEATDNLRRKDKLCKDLEAEVGRLNEQLKSSLTETRRLSDHKWDPEAALAGCPAPASFMGRVGIPLACGIISFFLAMFLTKMGHI